MVAVNSAGMEVLEKAGLSDQDGAEIPVGFYSVPSTDSYASSSVSSSTYRSGNLSRL